MADTPAMGRFAYLKSPDTAVLARLSPDAAAVLARLSPDTAAVLAILSIGVVSCWIVVGVGIHPTFYGPIILLMFLLMSYIRFFS